MHIGSCSIFDGPPPGFDEILGLIAGQAAVDPSLPTEVALRARRRRAPVWVDDGAFDLVDHVRHTALPASASLADLDTVIGRVMSQELDRHRPLWEAWMIGGLPDDRWALVFKVHHCMVDGVSGADLMTTLPTSDRPSPRCPVSRRHPSLALALRAATIIGRQFPQACRRHGHHQRPRPRPHPVMPPVAEWSPTNRSFRSPKASASGWRS